MPQPSAAASPGSALHATAAVHVESAPPRLGDHGAGDGMLGSRFHRRGRGQRVGGGAGRVLDHRDDARLPAREGAGLVERDGAHTGQPFQVRATLDQHAASGRRGQRCDDRDWRGDDQRARARHHQQDQRAIAPRVAA